MRRPDAPEKDGRSALGVLLGVAGFAGGGLALQARVNGELGVRLGSPLAAGAVNVVGGLVIVTIALAIRRAPIRRVVPSEPTRWWHWTGGLCAVAFVYAVVVATPRVGVSVVGVCTAAGMTCAGLMADRIGLGPSGRRALTTPRVSGAVIAVAAVVISHFGGLGHAGEWRYVALALAGGVAVGFQHPINSRLGAILGDGGVAAFTSFAVGSTAILILAATHLPTRPWPSNPALYLGGVLAAIYVLMAIPVVARIGALRLSLATMTGQLFAAAVLDSVAPIGGNHLTTATVVGLLLAVTAVAVASRAGRQ